MHLPRRKSILLLSAATLVAAPSVVVAKGGDDDRGRHGKHGAHHGATGTTPPATIALPNGWQPEGIAAGKGSLYVGSIPTGGVYRIDPRTGTGAVLVAGRTGRAATGLKVAGRYLVVSGGTTGHAFVYDAKTGADVADVTLTTGNSFINDVAVAGRYAYFTDSRQLQLYRLDLGTRAGDDRGRHGGGHHVGTHLSRGGSDDSGRHGSDDSGKHGAGADDPKPTTTPGTTGVAATAVTIPVTGALAQADDGDPTTNEANGIVILPGGRTAIVVNSRLGQLFKVDLATGASTPITLTGGDVANGDGLLLKGRTLYAVQNRLNKVAVITLAKDLASATVDRTITNAAFRVPTTIAKDGKDLFAVNARFGTPATPDTDYDVVRFSAK